MQVWPSKSNWKKKKNNPTSSAKTFFSGNPKNSEDSVLLGSSCPSACPEQGSLIPLTHQHRTANSLCCTHHSAGSRTHHQKLSSNAWLENRSKIPPMVTAPHHYLWVQRSPVFWYQDHKENKFNHAGTEERRFGPESWSSCSHKERKGHLDKSDGLGEDSGTEQQCSCGKPGAEQRRGLNLRKWTQIGRTGTSQAKRRGRKR